MLNPGTGPQVQRWLSRLLSILIAAAMPFGQEARAGTEAEASLTASPVLDTPLDGASSRNLRAQQAWLVEMERIFARYLAHGRSDKEIAVRMLPGASGSGTPFARTETRSDAESIVCTIGGLRTSYKGQVLGFIDTPVMRAGVAIHEHCHCLVDRNLLRAVHEEKGLEYRAEFLGAVLPILDLAGESISDARAVIELGRVDGLDAAREFLSKTGRTRSEDAGWADFAQTQRAMALAYAWLKRQAGKAGAGARISPEDAFEAAVTLGLEGMRKTLDDFSSKKGWKTSPYLLARVLELLEAGGRDAVREFKIGRYAGNLITLEAGSLQWRVQVQGGISRRHTVPTPVEVLGRRETASTSLR